MTRVLVTGGAGSIGSNLVRALLARGDEVTVLDDLSSGRADHLPDGVHLVRGSVTNDELVTRLVAGADEVFHLAALFANQNSVEHPKTDLDVNGLGTLNVFEAVRLSEVRKVLYCSSSCVYGPKEVMREDDRDLRPETPYAITKLLGEHYADFWAAQHGIDVVTVRLFNCYGPGEMPGQYRNVVPNFLKLAMEGRPLVITGTGTETRDFTYVDDVVDGMLAAMRCATRPGAIYNLGRGEETSIMDLARLVNEVAGNDAGIRHASRREWDHVVRRRAVIAAAAADLGFNPHVGLREGLERTYAWLQAQ